MPLPGSSQPTEGSFSPSHTGQELICLSLANLYLIQAWRRVPRPTIQSFEFQQPTCKSLCAVVADILILTIAFQMLASALRRVPKCCLSTFGRTLFPFVVAFPFFVELAYNNLLPVAVVFALATVVLSLRWNRCLLTSANVLALLMLPLLPLECLIAGKALLNASNPQVRLAEPRGTAAATPRVIWLLFDELDETLSFSNRPGSVRMPEFDRLQGTAFHASDAEPPAYFTEQSIPALIIGRSISRIHPRLDGDFDLTFVGESIHRRWRTQSSVFETAQTLGVRTAVVGWYLPYCSALGVSLNYCYSAENVCATVSLCKAEYDRNEPLSKVMYDDLMEQATVVKESFTHGLHGVTLGQKLSRAEVKFERGAQQAAYLDIRERAIRLVSDRDYGLVLIHLPLPHPFGMYHRLEQRMALDNKADYLDNLELADRTLGELRKAMEVTNVWRDSVVLLTGDHGYRSFLWAQYPEQTS